jgi:peptidoglycan/LPS O-acetylase OafA/YrhL
MLMGILSAWIAVRIRQKRTEKSILLQQEMHQRWNQWYVLVSHLVGGALLLLVIYLPFDYVKNLERWPLAANIVYLYFSRIVWSAGIALLILPTIINPRQTSLMTALFAWKPWAVLSRLTYSVYMVHVMVIHWLIDTRQREDSFTPQLGIAYYGGVVWWSYLLGGLLFLIVEQPVAQLLKMLVGR